MIQLNPAGSGDLPWMDELPPAIRKAQPPVDLEGRVRQDLAAAQLHLHSFWKFSVPEWFNDTRELYVWLTWAREPALVAPFEDVAAAIAEVFARHAGPNGLAIPHERFLWKATRELA